MAPPIWGDGLCHSEGEGGRAEDRTEGALVGVGDDVRTIVAGMPLNMIPTKTADPSTMISSPVRMPTAATAQQTKANTIVGRRPKRSEIEPMINPPTTTANPMVVKASAARPELQPASSSRRATVKLITRM